MDGDVVGFFIAASNTASLELLYLNQNEFQARHLYERALAHAWTTTRTNHRRWPVAVLKDMFRVADRQRLRQLGSALPETGPFRVYRGVAGVGAARRVRGLSWTLDINRAWWFARRAALPSPAVFTGILSEPEVLLYTNARNEHEIVAFPENIRRLKRLK